MERLGTDQRTQHVPTHFVSNSAESLQPHKDIAALPVRLGWITPMPLPRQMQVRESLGRENRLSNGTVMPNSHKTSSKSWLQDSILLPRAKQSEAVTWKEDSQNSVARALYLLRAPSDVKVSLYCNSVAHKAVTIKGNLFHTSLGASVPAVTNPLCRGNILSQGHTNIMNHLSLNEPLLHPPAEFRIKSQLRSGSSASISA